MENILDYSVDDSDASDHENPPNNDSTIIKCMICQVNTKQYKCPACFMLTCSLTCCSRHKQANNCNGKRNTVDFIKIKEYNDMNLRNDYHFLEDVLQTKQRGKRLMSDVGRIRYLN